MTNRKSVKTTAIRPSTEFDRMSVETNNNGSALSIKHEDEADGRQTLNKYGWIPQCSSPKLIESYMQSLPLSDLPLNDSDSMQLRRLRW